MKEEYVVTVPKVGKLKPYEKYLKKFKYKKALYSCLLVSSCYFALVCDYLVYDLMTLAPWGRQVTNGVQPVTGTSSQRWAPNCLVRTY